jgi:hypothetical protein
VDDMHGPRKKVRQSCHEFWGQICVEEELQ